MNPQNPPPNFQVFAKLMEMTSSSNDNEALTALRKANAMLGRVGRTWTELLQGKVTMLPGSPFEAIPDPFAKPAAPTAPKPKPPSGPHHELATEGPEIEAMFDALLMHVHTSFRNYIVDVHDWWETKQFLTHAQYLAIKKAYDRL